MAMYQPAKPVNDSFNKAAPFLIKKWRYIRDA